MCLQISTIFVCQNIGSSYNMDTNTYVQILKACNARITNKSVAEKLNPYAVRLDDLITHTGKV